MIPDIDWIDALTKALAQAGAMGAVVSLMIEQFRPLLSLRTTKLLTLVVGIAFVYLFEAYPLGALGLQTPNHWVGIVFNGLLVAGAAKVTNDSLNAIDRRGDRE